MSKSAARAYTRACLKVFMASVMVATQCIIVAPGIRGQAQNPPVVDLPSLAGKNMGDIIQQFKSLKKKCKEVDKEFLARLPSGAPSFDDICAFKIGNGRLTVGAYQGRAVIFQFLLGLEAPTEPEEALRRVGINVNGAEPQIQEGPAKFYSWSGTFNGKKWKEIKVHQVYLKNRKCPVVIAFLSDKAG